MKKLILLITFLATISLLAQQPPMPPMPPMPKDPSVLMPRPQTLPMLTVRMNPFTTNEIPKADHTHLITNVVEIPCRDYFYFATTHTGEMVYLGKLCSQDALTNTSWNAYRLILRSTNFTVLTVIANNPVPPPPSAIVPISPPLPPPPPSLKTSAVLPPPTWTNNPNLRLTITRTNGTTCVTFPTETNKLYECQATDNAGQSWLGSLKIVGTGKPVTQCDTTTHSSRLYRVSETPALKTAAAVTSVLADTTPPNVSVQDISQANITNFPHDVLFRYILGTGNGNQWWTDPENTNLNTGKIFDVQFPSKSNEFILPFSTSNLNVAWKGFPISSNLQPSRSSMTQGLFFPIYPTGSRFYTIRSILGTNRITWNL